jgi:hypothetical protein
VADVLAACKQSGISDLAISVEMAAKNTNAVR